MAVQINRNVAENPQYRLKIQETICARWPDYGQLLSDGVPPSEADRMLGERGSCSENELLAIYCENLATAPFDEESLIVPERFQGISENYLETFCVLPYSWDAEKLELLIADPYSLEQHAGAFGAIFERKVSFLMARRSLVERLIRTVYADERQDSRPVNDDENALRQLAGEARIVRLVNEMLTQALEQSASDIHVEPEESRMRIRFRIDGILKDYLNLPAADYPAIASRIKLIGNLNIAECRLPQDGRTSFHVGHFELDIRISTIPVMLGESIVMRLLRKDAMKFNLRELGMSERTLDEFSSLVAIPHGIILVVGPTGSGKTTTLYSVMQHLNDNQKKIITIEDPVEYHLPGLCQMQVNPKIGLTFASGLRHIVRQDPDVILVGEIRDRETADIAINAALTGHLVLSTLHTNDAAGAVTRLLDMGVENFLVASALFGVLSQRLVRTICPQCRSGADRRCRHCGGTGYRGRIGIYELMAVNDELRRGIIASASVKELDAVARRNGMVPLLEDGLAKARAGVTTETEVIRAAGGGEHGK